MNLTPELGIIYSVIGPGLNQLYGVIVELIGYERIDITIISIDSY